MPQILQEPDLAPIARDIAGVGGRPSVQRIIHCMYVCVDCPPIRANASCNGLDNCATSCWDGYFEMDSVCVQCTKFNQTTCPAGNYLKPCGVFYDAECLPCVEGSKPDYYSQWYQGIEGPTQSCTWECLAGYVGKQLAPGLWECVPEDAWSIWDISTV